VKRREFITLLGGAAAWPVAARAQQQAAMPVIGYVGSTSLDQYADRLRAFRQGLNETGHVDGRNVGIEFRWAENRFDRFPAIVADLVRQQVTVIAVAGSTPGARAAQAATATIPIVFAIGSDPVQLGLVASLNRPGGNLTGVTILNVEVMPKRLELLHELVPTATIMALLVNPTSPNVAESEAMNAQAAARALGLQMHVLNASTESEIDTGLAIVSKTKIGGLVIGGDVFLFGRRAQIVALAARHSIPAIYDRREFPAAGGLMSYGASLLDVHRQLGVYTGRILKGERPADLPVVQPTKFELVINLKTAKALGLNVLPTLLARADEVIE
jgi:ABC-type uncharacterized transport system substrate-binding protein